MNNDLINRGDALAVAQYSTDKVEGIKNLPAAADAVEVVRCKDCKYYNIQALACFRPNFNGWIGMNGFCSYGERRMDGE